MGAHGYEIFHDDANCDFAAEIADFGDAIQEFSNAFERACKAEYLDYDEGSAALVSAVIIDAILNDTIYPDETENFRTFVDTNKKLSVDKLKKSAVKALDRVLDEDSELNELWNENEEDYPKWRGVIVQLQNRLK